MGLNGWGSVLVKGFVVLFNVEVGYVCDVDFCVRDKGLGVFEGV